MGLFAVRKDGKCISISLANAVHVLVGEDEAQKVLHYFRVRGLQVQKLKECSDIVRRLKVEAELVKLSKDEWDKCDKNRFEYVNNQENEIFLIRLQQHGVVDHVAAVDCNRIVILDEYEKYPVSLSVKNIILSAGRVAARPIIVEMRQLKQN